MSKNKYIVFSIWIGLIINNSACAILYDQPQQITKGTEDHRWPSINKSGEIVWCQRVSGSWQVMKRSAETNPQVTPITQPTQNLTFFQYPSIDDNSNIICAGWSNSTAQWWIIQYPGNITVEFSSRDQYSQSHRDAGPYTGLTSNGKAIWYYDFYNTSGSLTGRRLSVTGQSRIANNWEYRDYPDINNNNEIVYTNNGYIYKSTVANPLSGTQIAIGERARINNNGDIVIMSGAIIKVLLAPDYTETYEIGNGLWADINDNREVVYEDFDPNQNRQIYSVLPKPYDCGIDIKPYYQSGSNADDWRGCGLGEPRCAYRMGDEWSAYLLADPDSKVGQDVACPPSSFQYECGNYVHNQYKIGWKGCVLTSATMIINCLCNSDYNPSTVNMFPIFNNSTNVITNEILWPLVCREISSLTLSPFTHKRVAINKQFDDIIYFGNDFFLLMKKYLCQESVPVAIRVEGMTAGGIHKAHTVVAYGIDDDNKRILIHDPAARNKKYLDEYKNVPPYNKVSYIDVIRPSNSPVSNIIVPFNCPGHFIITDSKGRRLGYDPFGAISYNEIPDSVYSVEYPNSGEDEDLNLVIPEEYATKVAYLSADAGENITIQVIGTGSGSGNLSEYIFGNKNIDYSVSEQQFNLSPGSLHEVTIKIPVASDFDMDGDTDSNDLAILCSQWLLNGELLSADIAPQNGDGTVNMLDFAVFTNEWLDSVN